MTKRRSYDPDERVAILKKCKHNKTRLEVVEEVRAVEAFSRFHKPTLKRFLKHKDKVCKKRGRKVNSDFEDAVLGCLVYSVLEKFDDREDAQVVASIAHSYKV